MRALVPTLTAGLAGFLALGGAGLLWAKWGPAVFLAGAATFCF